MNRAELDALLWRYATFDAGSRHAPTAKELEAIPVACQEHGLAVPRDLNERKVIALVIEKFD